MTRSSSRSSSRSFPRTLLCAPLALTLLVAGAMPACGVPNTDSATNDSTPNDGLRACTEIGCLNTLTLHVIGSAIGLSGRVTIGDQSFIVTCDDPTTNEAQCDGSDLTFQLPDGIGGGEVIWSLSADGAEADTADTADTGGHGGGYAGNGTVTPAWSSSTPNGSDCPPTCWQGEATVELLGTP